MNHSLLISAQEDLAQYPANCQLFGNTLAIGDLHGNALKLLYCLLKAGLITLNQADVTKEACYEEFANFYNTLSAMDRIYDDPRMDNAFKEMSRLSPEQLTESLNKQTIAQADGSIALLSDQQKISARQHIKHYQERQQALSEKLATALAYKYDDYAAITEMIVRTKECPSSYTIRLIGDELADRGASDFLTLMVIRRLKQLGFTTEIYLSNHSYEAMNAYFSDPNMKAPWSTTFIDPKASSAFNSMKNLVRTVTAQQNDITASHVADLFENTYLPQTKLLGYSLVTPEKMKPTLYIYSHALIDLSVIKALAEKLGTAYHDEKLQQLIDSINALNDAYQTRLKNDRDSLRNRANTKGSLLCDDDIVIEAKDLKALLASPVYCVMWNRNRLILQRDIMREPFSIVFVHGHDAKLGEEANVINLDNGFAKAPGCERLPLRQLSLTEREQHKPQPVTGGKREVAALLAGGFFKAEGAQSENTQQPPAKRHCPDDSAACQPPKPHATQM